jgi:GAF domain/ANTAR domain
VAPRNVLEFSEQDAHRSGGLSAPFVAGLAITGASICVTIGDHRQSTISASDPLAAKVDELQYVLGEGPHWDALRSGRVVSAPDVQNNVDSQWPVLSAALTELDLGALFAFPLRMGAVTVGVADLYRSTPGAMDEREHAAALSLARATAPQALRIATALAKDDEPVKPGLVAELRREVHQATGMILVQLDVDATEAFLRLKAYSFSSGISIQEVAKDVVHRRLNFRDLPE